MGTVPLPLKVEIPGILVDECFFHSYNGFMKFYCAPMEGLTGYIYRNAQCEYFNTIDKYFSPFISVNQSGSMRTRELKDILPENNQGLVLVPQLLTNNARDFIRTAKDIKNLGYDEINLNLGCPSGTVVSKNKGSGFLAMQRELDAFLAEIYSQVEMKISVKTRIGKDEPEEFYELIEIFNKYPMEELIIHPRIQKDYYKNRPRLDIFREALAVSKNPVCYNGDIFTVGAYKEFIAGFPTVDSLMTGRGLLANPGLIKEFKDNVKLDKSLFKAFHDKLYNDYKQVLFGDTNVLYKMKGFWFYMIVVFSNNEKYAKRIKKSTRLSEYEEVISSLFREQDILEDYESCLVFKAY